MRRDLIPLDRAHPVDPPVYAAGRTEPAKARRALYPVLDAAFVVVATALSLWLAVLYLREGFSLSPTRMLYLVAFWIVFTYVALPRLHQVLTVMYLPDYFIGRTRTSAGVLSDPVNIALDGSAAEIHAAMRRAGFVLADERTLRSAGRMIAATVLRRSYARAPMSDLFLMGRRHDFAYQQEVGGTTAKRHHVRFWRLDEDMVLPGGLRVDWLAAATFDRGVGFSLFTGQITHRIDEDIDLERDYIVDSLRHADPRIRVGVVPDFSTAFHHRNGQGDRLRTDGALPVIDLRGVREAPVDRGATRPGSGAHARPSPAVRSRARSAFGRTGRSTRRSGSHRAELGEQLHHVVADIQEAVDTVSEHHVPPPTLLLVSALVLVQVLVVGAQWVARGLGRDLGSLVSEAVVLVPARAELWQPTVVGAAEAVLMVLVLARRRWARLALMVLMAADATIRLVGATALLHGGSEHSALAVAGISVLGLMALTSQAARRWVHEADTGALAPLGPGRGTV